MKLVEKEIVYDITHVSSEVNSLGFGYDYYEVRVERRAEFSELKVIAVIEEPETIKEVFGRLIKHQKKN